MADLQKNSTAILQNCTKQRGKVLLGITVTADSPTFQTNNLRSSVSTVWHIVVKKD